MKATVANGITFDDSDVVNGDNFIAHGEFNPNNVHPWLIHDHGFAVCVVFAESLQDALDEAADSGKIDSYIIEESGNTPGTKGLPASDYPTLGTDNEEGITRLGNASEPFDIDTIGVVELRNPKRSFAALYEASFPS